MYQFFFQHFLRDPKNVGAIFPLTKTVSQELIREVHQRKEGVSWNILEVGAGIGNVSGEIEKELHSGDQLDLIEIDAQCCRYLEQKFQKNPRVHTHCVSAFDWRPSYLYDFIISTLPLNSFSPKEVEQLFNHYRQISLPKAYCTYVEYVGLDKLHRIFSGKHTKTIIEKRRAILQSLHNQFLIQKTTVYSNILPCHIYHLQWTAPEKGATV